jgi:hypothetical protein
MLRYSPSSTSLQHMRPQEPAYSRIAMHQTCAILQTVQDAAVFAVKHLPAGHESARDVRICSLLKNSNASSMLYTTNRARSFHCVAVHTFFAGTKHIVMYSQNQLVYRTHDACGR